MNNRFETSTASCACRLSAILRHLETCTEITWRWFIWLVLLVFTARGLRWSSGLGQAGGRVRSVRRRQQHLPCRVRALHASSASRGLQSHRPDPSWRLQHHNLRAETEPQLLGWVTVLSAWATVLSYWTTWQLLGWVTVPSLVWATVHSYYATRYNLGELLSHH